jgi:hypothetical protein
MAFVVEDGTGKSDATSFCTVAFFDAYHAKKKYSATIAAALDNTEKENLLQEATELITREHQENFRGTPSYPSVQRLPFPRSGVPDPIKIWLNYNEMPLTLQQATAELAYRIEVEDQDEEPTRGLSSLGVGSINLVFDKENEAEPIVRSVFNFLRPLLKNGGGSAFGRLVR